MINNKGVSLNLISSSFPAQSIVANTLHIALFKGTQPKLAPVFDNLSGGSSMTLNWAACCTALGLTSANFMGDVAVPAITPVVNASSRTLTLPLAGVAANLTAAADGKPTFYVARICPANSASTWAAFNANAGISGPFWIGSVGPEGSDAELQFIGGTLKTGQAYRFLDLTFQL